METEFDKGLLLVSMDSSEDLSCIQFDLIVDIFVHIKSKQWHIDKESTPLARNQHQKSDKCMYSSFRDNVLASQLVNLIPTP